jgi:transcriptional regulator with XRE-family HTH domain
VNKIILLQTLVYIFLTIKFLKGATKMEQNKAIEIRLLYQQSLPVKDIAKRFNVSSSMVYSILRNESNHDPLYKLNKKFKVDPEAAWRLYKEGKTYAAISRELSKEAEFISPSLIGHHIRKKWAEENLQ